MNASSIGDPQCATQKRRHHQRQRPLRCTSSGASHNTKRLHTPSSSMMIFTYCCIVILSVSSDNSNGGLLPSATLAAEAAVAFSWDERQHRHASSPSSLSSRSAFGVRGGGEVNTANDETLAIQQTDSTAAAATLLDANDVVVHQRQHLQKSSNKRMVWMRNRLFSRTISLRGGVDDDDDRTADTSDGNGGTDSSHTAVANTDSVRKQSVATSRSDSDEDDIENTLYTAKNDSAIGTPATIEEEDAMQQMDNDTLVTEEIVGNEDQGAIGVFTSFLSFFRAPAPKEVAAVASSAVEATVKTMNNNANKIPHGPSGGGGGTTLTLSSDEDEADDSSKESDAEFVITANEVPQTSRKSSESSPSKSKKATFGTTRTAGDSSAFVVPRGVPLSARDEVVASLETDKQSDRGEERLELVADAVSAGNTEAHGESKSSKLKKTATLEPSSAEEATSRDEMNVTTPIQSNNDTTVPSSGFLAKSNASITEATPVRLVPAQQGDYTSSGYVSSSV
jgi:hypothetical protein